MTAGREATPKDAASTAKLKAYWLTGAGAAKIGWNSPGDYDRCVVEVTKAAGGHGSTAFVHGYCANLHKAATGATPGNAPGDGPRHQHVH